MLSDCPSTVIGSEMSTPAAVAAKTGAAMPVALSALNPNCFSSAREVVVENTHDDPNVWIHAPRLDRNLHIEIIVLRAQDQHARAGNAGRFQNRFTRCVPLQDWNTKRAQIGSGIVMRL